MLFPSVLTYWSQIRVVGESGARSSVRCQRRGGEREEWEFGWGRVVGELCGAYAVTSETGRMLAGGYPSRCSGI